MIKLNTFLKCIFYILLIFFLINYLFPGSLMGYFIFGDVGRHPSLSDNPIYQPIPMKFYEIGDLVNHFISMLLISFFCFCIYFKDKKFERLFYIILSFALILELFHFIIPNRAFQIYDVVANLSGVLFAYFIIVIYRFYNKNKL